jgi:4-amino-4-deoxy-L-arabinose transferase-like glycosyltransferase
MPLKKLHPSFGVFALVVLGVAIRVVGLTQPFVDFWSWRQSDVAMIAENFSRNGFQVFFPQINWAGPAPGYVGTEFQLVPLLAALLYRLFGVHEWIGRAVSVAFFAASLPVFFLLVRRLYTARAALAAVSVYIAVPLSIFSSRSFMPDMPALSLALVALYLFTRWLEHDSPLVFTGVSLALALAFLVKPFVATIGFALLYLAIGKYGRGWVRTPRLWALATLAVLPSLVWYAHAYYVSISNPPYHFFGSGGVGLGSLKGYAEIANEVVFVSLTPTVAVLASVGLLVRPRRPGGVVFHYWLIGVLVFLVTVARNPHQWYQLALVPIAAALAGAALDRLADPLVRAWGRGPATCVGLLLCLGLGFSAYREVAPLYQPWALPAFRAGVALRQLASRDALVAVVDMGDPTAIYYSGRKGWHFPQDFGSPVAQDVEAIREVEALRREGARYLVFLRHTMWWLDRYPDFGRAVTTSYRRVQETEDYVIFDLSRFTPDNASVPMAGGAHTLE